MNFVDRKFRILIRMYEGKILQEVMAGTIESAPFRVAARRIDHRDIVGWGEMRFKESENLEKEFGEFPCTLINFEDDDIICAWPMKKFEEELRKFADKYEAWEKEQ